MADPITVTSRLPMAIRITEPVPPQFKDKPGDAPPLRSAVLNGSNHPQAVGGAGVSQVDPELFQKWAEANPNHPGLLAKSIQKVDGEVKADPASFGFEPGLQKLAADAENTKSAAQGSTVQHDGPVSSDEMAATSDTPNDDSPRGDPDLGMASHSQVPATALVTEGKDPALPTNPAAAPAPAVTLAGV